MREISRATFPFLLALTLALLFAPGAQAQMDCNQCSPFDACGQTCQRCVMFSQDGCAQYEESECSGPCMECAPNWVETGREVRGTYGNGSMFSCSHHKVEWVTRYDLNECNTSSYYWEVSTCEDTLDGGKSGWFPDCCNGYGPNGQPNSTYTCNHQHNC